MPKILYIEDELTRNIATIRKFFEPVLRKDKRILSALSELENSDRPFPEDVIEACEPCNELDIAHTFPRALELVIKNHEFYDLVIIDRNLSLYQYDDEIDNIYELLLRTGQEYSVERIYDFHEREGDLLLLVLLRFNKSYKDKTYYLTANTGDLFSKSPEIQTLMDIDNFKSEHIIEKGSPEEEIIRNILSDMKAFRIQNSYKVQCDILRKRLTENDVNSFVKMIGYHMNNEKSEFLFGIRKLLDNLLHHIAYAMGEHDAAYWNAKNKKQLQAKSFIKGFSSGKVFQGLPAYDDKFDIGYNSIIRNACLSIFEISSDCGIHELSKAIDIESLSTGSLTNFTMQTLLNQINDIIIWYDKAMDRIKWSQS
ncbi:MAG: hypothetical protein WCY21_05570 [Candidatus Cloacimonadaceae bacterium]|jgi:hypothetical protein|nr:hypothetical protein [Candidatus Cloacimonadota bacterium]MDX9949148.1 hypothetical protein [Candidatus Syntrophosphaera sp.]